MRKNEIPPDKLKKVYIADAIIHKELIGPDPAEDFAIVDAEIFCPFCWKEHITGNEDFFPEVDEELTQIVSQRPLFCDMCGSEIITTAFILSQDERKN